MEIVEAKYTIEKKVVIEKEDIIIQKIRIAGKRCALHKRNGSALLATDWHVHEGKLMIRKAIKLSTIKLLLSGDYVGKTRNVGITSQLDRTRVLTKDTDLGDIIIKKGVQINYQGVDINLDKDGYVYGLSRKQKALLRKNSKPRGVRYYFLTLGRWDTYRIHRHEDKIGIGCREISYKKLEELISIMEKL